MLVDNTNIVEEVEEIIDSGGKPVHFQYNLAFVVHGELTPTSRIEEIMYVRDYTKHLGDVVVARVVLDRGVLYRHLNPLSGDLYAVVERVPILENSPDTEDVRGERSISLYRAILEPEPDQNLEGNLPGVTSPTAQEKLGLRKRQLQLIPLGVDKARRQRIGSNVANATPGDVLRGILTHAVSLHNVDDEYRIKGVDMVPPDNTKVREVNLIPPWVPVGKLHRYAQERLGGVYQTGIASYIQGDRWYIFPPYHTGRFEDEKRTLTLVNLPPNKAPGIERTYRVKDGAVMVLLTAETEEMDLSDIEMLNEGNGVMYLDANKVMDGFIKTEGNKSVSDATENMRSYAAVTRHKGDDYNVFSNDRISDNDCVEASKLTARNGRYFKAAWQNSDPDVLYPGMPVKLLTMYGEELEVVQEWYGVLVGVTHTARLKGQGLGGNQHYSSSELTLFLKRQKGGA